MIENRLGARATPTVNILISSSAFGATRTRRAQVSADEFPSACVTTQIVMGWQAQHSVQILSTIQTGKQTDLMNQALWFCIMDTL